MSPYHSIWERRRLPHHGGAIRPYLRPSIPPYGRTSPLYCSHCMQAHLRQKDEEHSPLMSDIKLDLLDEIDLGLQHSGYGKGECLSVCLSLCLTPGGAVLVKGGNGGVVTSWCGLAH